MADVYQWFIRFLHILAGVMWVGGIFLWSMVIAPSLEKRVPPQAAGPTMMTIAPRLPRYFGIAGAVTVITGLWNMGLLVGFGNIGDGFQQGSWGIALGASFFTAIIMLVVAFGVLQPSVNKMLDLAKSSAGAPPADRMAPLKKKVKLAGMTNLLLGTLALALMAWATHVGVGG